MTKLCLKSLLRIHLLTTISWETPEQINGEYSILFKGDDYLIERIAESINTVLGVESKIVMERESKNCTI